MFNKIRVKLAFTCAVTALFMTHPMMAQFARTWVSQHGKDSNDCSIDHPCHTFQAAHNKTSPDGEIDVLDPADYGPVTITHAITIDGGNMAYISVGSMFSIGIDVQAQDVTVRNLSILNHQQFGIGGTGIRWHLPGGISRELIVEGVSINGFGSGIGTGSTEIGDGRLRVNNSTILHCNSGVLIAGGPLDVIVEHTLIDAGGFGSNGIGFWYKNLSPATAQVNHSTISGFEVGVYVGGVTGTEVNVEDSSITDSGKSGIRAVGQSIIYIAGNDIHGNGLALLWDIVQTDPQYSAQIISFGNNRISGNGAGETPSSTIALK